MAQCKVFGFANRRKRKPTSLLVLVGYRTQGQTRSSAKLDVANVPAKYFKNGSTLDPPPQRSNAVTSKSTKTLKSNCISVILQFWKTHDRLVFVTTDHTRVQQCPSQLVEQQLAPAATTTTTITLNYKTTFVTYIVCVHNISFLNNTYYNIFIFQLLRAHGNTLGSTIPLYVPSFHSQYCHGLVSTIH
jgi:hypothetical protein